MVARSGNNLIFVIKIKIRKRYLHSENPLLKKYEEINFKSLRLYKYAPLGRKRERLYGSSLIIALLTGIKVVMS